MADLVNTLAHRAARNAASIALADSRAGFASLRFYQSPGGDLRGIRYMAKPCGVVRPVDSLIVLSPSSEADQVMTTGGVHWADWCDGDGVAISGGWVTDQAGNFTDETGQVLADSQGVGPFVLAGTEGTTVYFGGLVHLYSSAIG